MLRGLNLQMLAFEQLLPGQVLVIGHFSIIHLLVF
jgi:hypothetical protein